MDAPAPALLLVVGLAGAWILFGSGAAPPPEPEPEPEPEPPGGGFLDQLGAGVAGGLGRGIGQLIEGGAGILTSLGEQAANDPESAPGRGARQLGRNVSNLVTGGKARKKTKKKRQQNQAIEQTAFDAERWAAHAWTVLSRHDVREWVVSSTGKAGAPVIDVYFAGVAAPHRLEVPERASIYRLAWVAEPIVRTLGRFVQRGGRIDVPWTTFDPPSFDDRNPYAPPGMRISERGEGSTKWEQEQLRNVARRGRTLGSKNVQRGLDAEREQAVEAEE